MDECEHPTEHFNDNTERSVASMPVAPKPSDYLSELANDNDITEAQRIEYLSILFEIMKGFVHLGYGLTPVQNMVESFENAAKEDLILVKCEYDQHDPL